VTLLNYSLRYINNFIYLSIYPTAILNETALVCQQLRFEAPKDVKLEMLISLKNSVSFAMHTLIFLYNKPITIDNKSKQKKNNNIIIFSFICVSFKEEEFICQVNKQYS